MRRPSIEASADDLSFAEPSHYAVEEGLAVQSATCPAGQSCTGCFSGSVLAYMALLLFDNSSVVIFMMVCCQFLFDPNE